MQVTPAVLFNLFNYKTNTNDIWDPVGLYHSKGYVLYMITIFFYHKLVC